MSMHKKEKSTGGYRNYIKLCAALLLYLFAVRSNVRVQARAGYAAAFLSGGAVTAEEAGQICEAEAKQEQPAAVCFFGEQPDLSLSCRETGGEAVVDQIPVVGNAELLVPGSNALAFQKNGCYLDTETARALFGTDEVAGQIVRSGDQSWQVLGTFDSLQKEMLCVAGDGALNRILLSTVEQKQSRAGLEQLLLRAGLTGDVVDFAVLSALIQDLQLMVPLLLFIRFAGRLLEGWKVRRRLPVTAGISLVGLFILSKNARIPADLIPTQWSDFSFWSVTWIRQKQNFLLILQSAAGEASLDMLWYAMCSAGENALAICLLCTV